MTTPTTATAAALSWLARSELFSTLPPADLQTIAAEMREVTFTPGQVIFGRGDEGRDLYLVTVGRVRLSVLTAEGRELSFAHAEPGVVFGEIAMLDGGTRTADATAVAKTTALTLSRAAFERLSATRPAMATAALRFVCRRLREADQQLEAIALYPIEVRLARFFLATARQKSPDADAPVAIDLDMSQSELALLVGASRPKVNAALATLESRGGITRDGTRITCDIDALEDIAG